MDEQTHLKKQKESSQRQAAEHPLLLGQDREQRMESFVPDQDERFLKPVTRAGYRLQKNYRSYTTTQLKHALDQGDYKVVGRTFRGSRTRKSKKKKDNHHSEIMTPLVEKIDQLEIVQNTVITPENVEEQIELLMKIYDHIFKLAYNYCEKQDPWFPEGKARWDMVLLIRDQANEERLKIGHNARVLANEVKNNPEQTYTFADAIKEIRTQKIKAGENGIKEIQAGGKGTSDIIVALKEDGSKLYIRPSESLKNDDVPCSVYMGETISHTKEEIAKIEETLKNKDLTEEEKKKETQNLTDLQSDLKYQEILERVLQSCRTKKEETIAEYVMRKLSFCRPSNFREKINGEALTFIRRHQELYNIISEASRDPVYQDYALKWSKAGNHKRSELNQEFDQKDSMIGRFLRAVKQTGKHLNQRDFARNVAMVKEGSNISNRNVAVSILARALGLRDMVAESQMVEVEVNGKKIRGTIMEEAKGVDLSKAIALNKFQRKETVYSVNALKQLTSLQVFDILCGQIDRKPDNYMTVIRHRDDDTDEIMGIKAIDNDMSCGMIDYEQDVVRHFDKRNNQRVRGYRQQLPAISDDRGLVTVEAIDKNLKDRIMAMSPAFIDFLLAGILSEEERNAMKGRLLSLQMLFMNEENYARRTGRPSVFMKTEKDWMRFRSRFGSVGTVPNTYLISTIPS